MNDFIASLYDPWFDYVTYNKLINSVFDIKDFQKLGFGFLIVSILGLIVFYKLWDPVKKPRLKWFATLLSIGLIMSIITYSLLSNNVGILTLFGNYSGSPEPDPQYFIFQMAAISFLYGVILSAILSISVKFISVANKYNPF